MSNLTFETFEKFFTELKKIWDYEDALNALNQEYQSDSRVYISDIIGEFVDVAIEGLAANFNNISEDVVADWIHWWICETEMGQTNYSIRVSDSDGARDIEITSPKELWDFLIKECK